MAELLGTGYVVDRCILAARDWKMREAYGLYVSELARSANNSIAKAWGGTEFGKSWQELLEYRPETRSAGEIKSQMLGKLKALGD